MSDQTPITDPDDYNPVGPIRTFQAKVRFVDIGPMPAMKVEFDDE